MDYLVRDVVPVKVEGLHAVVLGQDEDCQVVAGAAGIQEDHRSSEGCCLAHGGPLIRNNSLDVNCFTKIRIRRASVPGGCSFHSQA